MGFGHFFTDEEIDVYANYHLKEQVMAAHREDLEKNHEAFLFEAP